jgi:hypothetical protein
MREPPDFSDIDHFKNYIFKNTRNLSGYKVRIGHCLAQLRRAKGNVYFLVYVKGCWHSIFEKPGCCS